jgi:hypothetical protein
MWLPKSFNDRLDRLVEHYINLLPQNNCYFLIVTAMLAQFMLSNKSVPEKLFPVYP